eukprot:2958497-Prymnesium_polylepis.1
MNGPARRPRASRGCTWRARHRSRAWRSAAVRSRAQTRSAGCKRTRAGLLRIPGLACTARRFQSGAAESRPHHGQQSARRSRHAASAHSSTIRT